MVKRYGILRFIIVLWAELTEIIETMGNVPLAAIPRKIIFK